jgi:hypothetical protein
MPQVRQVVDSVRRKVKINPRAREVLPVPGFFPIEISKNIKDWKLRNWEMKEFRYWKSSERQWKRLVQVWKTFPLSFIAEDGKTAALHVKECERSAVKAGIEKELALFQVVERQQK